mgnify:CR=1 FL=1
MFLISQHLTVRSSLPDTILSVAPKTAEVTELRSQEIIKACNNMQMYVRDVQLLNCAYMTCQIQSIL